VIGEEDAQEDAIMRMSSKCVTASEQESEKKQSRYGLEKSVFASHSLTVADVRGNRGWRG
jgi:hypothetical protein